MPGMNVDTENENKNHSIPKKNTFSTMGYLGPYRSNPNFTRGRKLSIGTAKSSTPKVNIQTSFLNNQFVVAKKKVTKRVDRSEGRSRECGKKLKAKGESAKERKREQIKLAAKVARKSTPADRGVKKPHSYQPGTCAL